MQKNNYSEIAFLREWDKPVQKEGIISFKIKKYLCDENFDIQNFSDAPIDLPYFLFGLYDFYSGYKISLKNLNFSDLNFKVVWGSEFSVINAATGNENHLSNFINFSDILFIYKKETYYYVVQLYSEKFLLNSILMNSSLTKIETKNIKVFSDNFLQYKKDVKIIQFNELSEFNTKLINPLSFYTSDMKQNDFVLLPIKMRLNQYNCLCGYIDKETKFIEYQFEVKY